MTFSDNTKIALALGGGAAKGLAHIGVLKALEEAGIHPAIIAGTSMGSLIGGMYARGMSVDEIAQEARQVTMAKSLQLFRPAFRSSGFVEDRKILELLEGFCGSVRIEDLPIPFIACAVDFRTGRTHYLKSGRLLDAIRASIAIPGIFQPVKANGTLLADGGLTTTVPLGILRDYKPDKIIGVNVLKTPDLSLDSYSGLIKLDARSKDEATLADRILKAFTFNADSRKTDSYNLQRTILQSVHILLNALTESEIKRIQPELMIEPDMTPVNLWEFWKGEEAIAIGYATAGSALRARFD